MVKEFLNLKMVKYKKAFGKKEFINKKMEIINKKMQIINKKIMICKM